MATTDTRDIRNIVEKIDDDYATLKTSLNQMNTNKNISNDLVIKIAELENAIAAIGNTAQEDAIKATVLYKEIVEKYNKVKTNADNIVIAKRLTLAELNVKVAADDDYAAEQKLDFLDAKNNEV